MLAMLKIVHYLSLAAGLGGGVANAIVGAKVTGREPGLGAPAQKLIGRLSFAALVLLWITGIWMGRELYALSDYCIGFWLKMLAVLALTTAAVTAQTGQLRGTATPQRMKMTSFPHAAALRPIFDAVLVTSR